MSLEDKIELCKNEMFKKFPECNHTISINLWDDGTDEVMCRHGDTNGLLHITKYYNSALTYYTVNLKYVGSMIVDKNGREYFSKKELKMK